MSQWRHAFSLSKQQVAEAEPPGTVQLIEHEHNDHITLIPPPTLSQADPLNWSRWRKYTVLAIMSIYCFAVNFASACVAPALQLIMFQLPRPLTSPPPAFGTLTHLVAFNVLMIGLGNIIWVPVSNIIGRRPVLILTMAITVASSAWCAVAGSFNSLLAARIVQGFGMGPADSSAANVVGEIFFVHERGRAMAIYTIFLSGGSFVGGVAGGYIAGTLNYRYVFWISLAMLAFVLVAQIVLVPETRLDRAEQLLQDQISAGVQIAYGEKQKAGVETIERAPTNSLSLAPQEFTFASSLRIGVYRGNVLQQFIAPWKTLLLPGTWVVCLHYGGLLGGLVTISTVGPQFLAMPPYLWGNNVGLLNLGGLAGTIRKAQRESHGLAEPESRLPILFPALMLATGGILCFGFSAANPSTHAWAGLVVGLGMVGAGITQIPSVGFNYLIDAYGQLAADCFVMTTIARSIISFAWTFFAGDWVASAGPALPFGIFGMLMGVFGLLTVPLWLFGKRMRIATADLMPREE
ncbi:Putative major facilitator superfamily, MFS transporter superfamily [Septoria linicola]|uniref:Major facilitator superfamily, MFS transporter superfamily n=1 Tax=Septoria linicola TaxID=215465 RepID=A0A9Q9ATU5_9PEZI|nr:Putative major facilitator superfamily, MFS transporter superfamily [Septoria linicola]